MFLPGAAPKWRDGVTVSPILSLDTWLLDFLQSRAQIGRRSASRSRVHVFSHYTSAMLPIGSHPAWHPVFETLAYAAGYVTFRSLRARRGDVIAEPQRWTVLAAAALGALG